MWLWKVVEVSCFSTTSAVAINTAKPYWAACDKSRYLVVIYFRLMATIFGLILALTSESIHISLIVFIIRRRKCWNSVAVLFNSWAKIFLHIHFQVMGGHPGLLTYMHVGSHTNLCHRVLLNLRNVDVTVKIVSTLLPIFTTWNINIS